VVAEVDEAECLRAERLGGHRAGAPVLHDASSVEGGLVHLVLGEEPPVGRQPGIDFVHRAEIALEGVGEMALAGKVRAVADPKSDRFRADLPPDRDAVEIVRDRLDPRAWVSVAEGPKPVALLLTGLVLKVVGVHRVEA
jgi:hypothetical protein